MQQPQSTILQQSLLNSLISNPLFLRAKDMAKGKSQEELEQIAINICKEKGIDYEKAKEQFKGLMSFK